MRISDTISNYNNLIKKDLKNSSDIPKTPQTKKKEISTQKVLSNFSQKNPFLNIFGRDYRVFTKNT